MCDHLLDAIEFAGFEERERRWVRACVSVWWEEKGRGNKRMYQNTALDLTSYQREGARRCVVVVGAGCEDREDGRWQGKERKQYIRTGTHLIDRFRDKPQLKVVVRHLGTPSQSA